MKRRIRKQVDFVYLAVAVLAVSANIGSPRPVLGQTAAEKMEFMESTSPLKRGGTITRRALPGQPIQTIITPPAASNANTATYKIGESPSPASTIPNSQLNSAAPVVYPYPGSGQVAWNQVPVPTTATIPTLGITPGSALRTNMAFRPNGLSAPPPTYSAPSPNAASTIPELGIEIPGSPAPTISYPQPISGGAINSPRYQPLVKLQNLPPGTYLGQGIIGQPKAYVDGQPVRNLLRYITP